VIVAQPLQFFGGPVAPRAATLGRKLARIRVCRPEIIDLVAQSRCGLARSSRPCQGWQSGGQQTEVPFCPAHDFKNQFDGGVEAFGVLLVKKIGICIPAGRARPPFWPA